MIHAAKPHETKYFGLLKSVLITGQVITVADFFRKRAEILDNVEPGQNNQKIIGDIDLPPVKT